MSDWTVTYQGKNIILEERPSKPMTFLLRDFFLEQNLRPLSREWMFDITIYKKIMVANGDSQFAVHADWNANIIDVVEIS